VHTRARNGRDERAAADADRLDRRDRHERLGQTAIQLAIPVDIAAEARRHAMHEDFEAAAHRIAGLAGAIDLRDHRLLDLRVDTPQR
jgi:hypothetical protein